MVKNTSKYMKYRMFELRRKISYSAVQIYHYRYLICSLVCADNSVYKIRGKKCKMKEMVIVLTCSTVESRYQCFNFSTDDIIISDPLLNPTLETETTHFQMSLILCNSLQTQLK